MGFTRSQRNSDRRDQGEGCFFSLTMLGPVPKEKGPREERGARFKGLCCLRKNHVRAFSKHHVVDTGFQQRTLQRDSADGFRCEHIIIAFFFQKPGSKSCFG